MSEPPSLTALKEAIKQDKLDAFEYMRDIARLTPEELSHAGYRGKTNAEAVLLVLNDVAKDIERKIQAWEKANPD